MWKVLKPLPGYGYLVGDIADVIHAEDVERFLRHKHIEAVEQTESKPAKSKKKESGK